MRLAAKQNTYDITLNNALFVDPTFEKVKRFTEFFPIKYETIIDGKFDRLSASSRLLLVRLLSLCYKHSSPIVQVNVFDLPTFRRVNVNDLFLELSDSGYLQSPIKKEIKKDIKEKKEIISTERPKAVAVVAPKTSINLLSKQVEIPNTLVQSWADTYPKEYLELELKKARSWLITNPHKAPKTNFGRFFNSWFDRGWEKYRQTLKTNPTQLTVEALEEILRKDAE